MSGTVPSHRSGRSAPPPVPTTTDVAMRARAPGARPFGPLRALALAGAMAGLAAIPAAATGAEIGPPAYALAGVSVAGAEFGDVPGALGRDYAYPSDAILDYFLEAGAATLRIPFRWERVQPTVSGPLARADMAEMDRVVARVTDRGGTVILDMHNYGRRVIDGAQRVIAESGDAVTAGHLADGWGRLAAHYAGNPRVVFGVMNEPHDQDGPTWVATQNLAVAAIRAAGANTLVLVTGTAYSGAHSWVRSGNAEALLAAVDPADHSAIEAHQYLDANNSGYYEDRGGSSASCVPGAGESRLRVFTDWLRATGRKGFLGEFGAPGDAQCLAELRALYAHLARNADVYLGATGWAAFPQSEYVLNLAPPPNRFDVDTPIFTTLRRRLLGRTKPLGLVADIPGQGVAGSSFSSGRIFGIGGRPGYVYDLARGALPPGLALDPATGLIPAATLDGAPGTYRFVPRVTDAAGDATLGPERTISVTAAPEGRFDPQTVTHYGYTNRAVANHSFGGRDRYALVAVFGRDLDAVRGVTCGGRPMLKLARSFEPDVAGAAIYGLADPPTGAQEIVVDLGSSYKLVSTVVQGVGGVDPREPVAAAGTADGIGGHPRVDFAAPSGTEIWQAFNARDAVATPPLAHEVVVADADPPDANLGRIRVSRRIAGAHIAPSSGAGPPTPWRAAAVALRRAPPRSATSETPSAGPRTAGQP